MGRRKGNELSKLSNNSSDLSVKQRQLNNHKNIQVVNRDLVDCAVVFKDTDKQLYNTTEHSFRQDLSKCAEKIKELRRVNEHLKCENLLLKLASNKYRSEVGVACERLETYLVEHVSCETSLQGLKLEKANMETEIKLLKDNLTTSRDEYVLLSKELESLKASRDEVESRLVSEKAKNNELVENVRSLTVAMDSSNKEYVNDLTSKEMTIELLKFEQLLDDKIIIEKKDRIGSKIVDRDTDKMLESKLSLLEKYQSGIRKLTEHMDSSKFLHVFDNANISEEVDLSAYELQGLINSRNAIAIEYEALTDCLKTFCTLNTLCCEDVKKVFKKLIFIIVRLEKDNSSLSKVLRDYQKESANFQLYREQLNRQIVGLVDKVREVQRTKMEEEADKRQKWEMVMDVAAEMRRMYETMNQMDNCVRPITLLVDYYELTMVHAYWQTGKHTDHAIFEIFFRKCPFGGEFCVFAGLEDCLKLLEEFRITNDDAEWLRSVMFPGVCSEFYDYLKSVTMDDVKLYAIDEGTPVFPHVPLIQVSGPLGKLQLLETALLNLVGYASLVTTNACKFVQAAGEKPIAEFGARKAHGPNGALSGSRYAFLGGCSSTSNVLASKIYGIPLSGTIAHSFIMSYQNLKDLGDRSTYLRNLKTNAMVDFKNFCVSMRNDLEEKIGMPIRNVNVSLGL
ncbi:hypothetical protein ACOME3_003224 [Neoechinorhynchus agilis]